MNGPGNVPSDGMLKTGLNVLSKEGIPAIYKGLSASLLRQGTYTTARFGLYLQIKDAMAPDGNLSLFKKFAVSMLAGAGGSLVGSPADVVLVRMQADGKLPAEKRRNYKHAFDGLYRIAKEEGIAALWKGCLPNLNRAMFMSAGQLASYDQAKQILLQTPLFKDNIVTHFTASLIAAFVATVLTNPLDVVKTRIMNQSKESTQLYKNSIDCGIKIFKIEGLGGFYKGFVPYFVRLGPQTILTFVFFEQYARLWDHFGK